MMWKQNFTWSINKIYDSATEGFTKVGQSTEGSWTRYYLFGRNLLRTVICVDYAK